MQKYQGYAHKLLSSFDSCKLQTVPRSTNTFADTMACLASQIPSSVTESKIFVTVHRLKLPSYATQMTSFVGHIASETPDK